MGQKILHLYQALQEGFYWSGTFEGHNRPHGNRSSKESITANSQFQSVFSLNTPLNLIHICSQFIRRNTPFNTPENLYQQHPTLPKFTMSVNGVKKMIVTLKPHKAAGLDQIRPLILKELRDQIPPILQVIFTRSYETWNYQENGNLPMLFQFTRRDLNIYPLITGRSH